MEQDGGEDGVEGYLMEEAPGHDEVCFAGVDVDQQDAGQDDVRIAMKEELRIGAGQLATEDGDEDYPIDGVDAPKSLYEIGANPAGLPISFQ